ncbi:autotransporter domain-containing protein [Devosia limi]
MSADGSVIVGGAATGSGQHHAFRWREGGTGGVAGNEQMIDLGTLGGMSSMANGVSSGGDYVVGSSQDPGGAIAFRWDEERGMVAVEELLSEDDVDVGDWRLQVANDVSTDGRVIIGTMNRAAENRAFLARLGDGTGGGGGGVMDVEEYNRTLYAGAGGIASAGEFLSWLPMNGAHHRPLMMTPDLTGDMCAWASGDFAHHGGTSTGLALAEIGACTDLAGGSVRIGGAVGTTRSWQDLSLGGASRLAGQYVLGEVDWQPDGTPLLLSATGMLGGWQANVGRAYSNGAATAVSSGQTRATGGVIRLRADWLEAVSLGNTTFNPWTSVSLGALHVDGYTESSGPFPALFNAQSMTHVDVRVGLTAVTEFSSQTKLSTTFEVAHRSGTAPGASGQVDGLFAFSLGGGRQSQTWVRAGVELDHKITDNLSLSTSVHLATAGRDPSIAGSLGVKAVF